MPSEATHTIVLDNDFLVSGWKNGAANGDPAKFLDALLDFHLRNGHKIVTNEVIKSEFLSPKLPPAELAARQAWWNSRISSNPLIDVKLVQNSESYIGVKNGGEKSLFERTIPSLAINGDLSHVRLYSLEDFLRKTPYKNLVDSHTGIDPKDFIQDWAGEFTDRVRLGDTTAATQAGQFDNVRATTGESGFNKGVLIDPGSGKYTGYGSIDDAVNAHWDLAKRFANAQAELHTRMGPGEFSKFSDLPSARVNYWLHAAGEAIGAIAVLADAYETRTAFYEALAEGNLTKADQILGGLVGRAFGGAFLAVIAGAAAGSAFGPIGAVIGAIMGGIAGTDIGGGLGERLFGFFGSLGLHASALVQSFSDFGRDLLGDPIVLDLDGDGIELTSLASSNVRFDLDGDGLQERVGWVSAQDGLLIHDLNGNGIVDDVGELFGSANVDGYDELKLLDSNSDNKITSLDSEFGNLKVWRDINQDGVSTSDEMFTLAQVGISRFNLTYTQLNSNVGGNVTARKGSYTRIDNTTREMASVWFGMDESVNRPVIPQGANIDEYYPLPNIPAVASMPDLWTAMYFDPVLKAMVEGLSASDFDFESFADFAGLPVTTPTSLVVASAGSGSSTSTVIRSASVSEVTSGRFIEILYRWAGVDTSLPQDPVRPWHLQVFEAITGIPLELSNNHQRERIEEMWPQLVGQMGTIFLIQAAHKPLLAPLYGLAQEIAALDPEDSDYIISVATLASGAIVQGTSLPPASEFLAPFRLLSLDPATGEIAGDFDAFVHAFSANEGGLSTSSMSFGTSATSVYGSWTAWYQNHGKFIFDVANAMGFSPDYVLRVTGWRWMFGSVGQVEGTSGNDILEQASSAAPRVTTLTSNGSISMATAASATRDQALYGYGGDDELRGLDGVDRLVGGVGNDLLKGGSGGDMYVYASGDGLDTIIDESGVDDVIYFSSELRSENLLVSRITGTNNLFVHFGDPAHGITLTNQWSSSSYGIEQFHFVGQDGLDAGDIASRYLSTLVTTGSDVIVGSWASEKIASGSGSDTVSSGDGDDILLGGEGDDSLSGELGNDALTGGLGNDTLNGGRGADNYYYNLGDGDDIINDVGSNDNETSVRDTLIFGGDIIADDLILSNYAGDWNSIRISFVGADGSIKIASQNSSTSGIESVVFSDESHWTLAELMARYVSDQQTSGDNLIHGSNFADSIAGGDGNDTVLAGAGNDSINGGGGNDYLQGGAGADTYIYGRGDGNDVVEDTASDNESSIRDTLNFGTGISASDLIFSNVANQWNTISVGLTDQSGSVLLRYQNNGDSGVESINFIDGSSWNLAQIMARYVSDQQTAGSDLIHGSNLADTVQAGSGNDTVITGGGDDAIEGGLGDDDLQGGAGADTYIYNLGDGDDIITDSDSSGEASVKDRLVFGAGITADNIIFSPAGESRRSLCISFSGAAGSVTIINQDPSNAGIETIMFADGTSMDLTQIMARFVLEQQSAGRDLINGSIFADTVVAGAGDDIISTGSGNDDLTGGLGNDELTGGDGIDTYRYALGDGDDIISDASSSSGDKMVFAAGITAADILLDPDPTSSANMRISFVGELGSILVVNQWSSTQGIERIEFADGTVWIAADIAAQYALGVTRMAGVTSSGTSGADTLTGTTGSDNLAGAAGNDLLAGGSGSDYLRGGAGNDTYEFNLGGGQDTIFESESQFTSGGNDTLRFGLGIAVEDLIFSKSTSDFDDLRIRIAGSTDSILIRDQDDNYQSRFYNRVENFVFQSEGPSGSITQTTLNWSDIEAIRIAQSISEGNDIVIGSVTANIIDGGGGNDRIYGWSGNDVLTGSTGNDFLSGGSGSDTYIFNLGDGQDVIFEGESDTASSTGTETLRFGLGISLENLIFSKNDANWNDLRISIAGTNDSILIEGQDVSYQSRFYNRIENFVFQREENGSITETTLTWSDINAARLAQVSTSGNDVIVAGTAAETVDGGAGNDVIYGWSGNDTLSGGTGNDFLSGGSGSDTYRFNLGDGQDTIFDNESDTSTNLGTETLRFGLGISLSDLIVSKSNAEWNDVLISIAGTSDSILLDEQDVSYQSRFYNRIENFVFQALDAGGSIVETTLSWAALDAYRIAQAKTTANDIIIGGSGADTVDGGSGDDLIYGWSGNDLLVGGAGNDYLDGGAGTDIAVLSGLSVNYSILVSGGIVSVVDDAPSIDGDDGEDSLVAVEKLRFSDGQEIGISAPIILDLDGGGVTTLSASDSNALYDMDGDGVADDTSWMGSGEGMLFLDRDGNGTLSNAGEFSFVNDLEGAASDLAGLRAFDSDGDGWLSSSDARFMDFRIWRDGNGDGAVDQGEVFSLVGAGVQSLDLTGVEVNGKVSFGDVVTINRGSFTRSDGTAGEFIDAALTYFSGASQSIIMSSPSQPTRLSSRGQLQAFDRDELSGGRHRRSKIERRNEGNPIAHWPQFNEQKLWSELPAVNGVDQFSSSQTTGAVPASSFDRQHAMMVQEMSAFGAQSAGEAIGAHRENVRPLEFFA